MRHGKLFMKKNISLSLTQEIVKNTLKALQAEGFSKKYLV